MVIKLNSFSNKGCTLEDAQTCVNQLADVVNVVLEAAKKMTDAEHDDSVCKEVFEDTYWKLYNRLSYLETDKHRHPRNEQLEYIEKRKAR